MGAVGFASFSGYVAAKHGVVGLTQNAALEYSDKRDPHKLRCARVYRYAIIDSIDVKSKESLALKHPIGRLGKAGEVAEMVIWLSSKKHLM